MPAIGSDPRNIRLFLPLFHKVLMILPPRSDWERVLEGLHVSEDELVELAVRGRLAFILPWSVERYPTSILNRLAEAKPDSLVLSRRLASLMVLETRRRVPILYPAFGTSERHQFLRLLTVIANSTADAAVVPLARALLTDGKRSLMWPEVALHRRGALAATSHGSGPLVAEILNELGGKDLRLETMLAGAVVDWGAALDAVVCPSETEQRITEFVAGTISGVGEDRAPARMGEVETILDGLLAIDNDAPVLEVERTFQGGDIERLRGMVWKVRASATSATEVRSAVTSFNEGVKAYERRVERLRLWNVVGLANALISTHVMGAAPTHWLPLGVWALGVLVTSGVRPHADLARRLLDAARAAATWKSSDVVMVAHLRAELKAAHEGKP